MTAAAAAVATATLLHHLLALVCLGGDGGVAPDARADASVDGALSQADVAVAGTDAGTAAAEAGAAPSTDAAAPVPGTAARPAQGVLKGRIFARGSRRPVAGATVIVGVAHGADSDAEGRFSVAVACGSHAIAVQAPRFEPALIQRDACADPTPVELRLTPRAAGAAFETVVRAPGSQQQVRLQGEELLRTPGTMGDPFRAVESLPGVTAVAWPAPVYAVRGANPGNTGFFLDELRVPALFHFALGPSVIHPYFFEGLELYPGGYPARFGRYVAGIVTARTRAPADDAVHASVDVRLFDAGAMVSAPLAGGGSVAVAARYSYTGPVIGLFSDQIRLRYWDYQLRADRALGPVRLTLLVFGSSDLLGRPASDPTSAAARELALRFHRLRLRAEVPVGRGRLAASLGVGSDHSKAPLVEGFPLVVDALSAMPRATYLRPSRYADLEVGFDGELQRYQPVTTVQRLGSLDLGQRRDARLLAGYVSAGLRPGKRLVLTPELRFDSYTVRDVTRNDLGPRASARLALDEQTWIQAAGGRFTQTPSLPLQLPGVESFGLALYGLQTSWQGSAGVGTTRLAGVEAGVTVYVQRYVLTDLRDATLARSSDPLADDFLVRRDALSYGLELLVRRPPTERLHGWLSYTLSNNLRALGGGVIAPSDWDQRHVVNLVLGYRMGRTTVGGRAHYNSGRPVLISSSQGQEFTRLPAFYQLDLRCDRRVLFDTFALDLYVELVNATLSRQVIGLTQQAPGAPPKQDGFRIVLPSMGVHGEF